ncbi:MAG: hypothetical protein PW791_01825 [Neorhizobium sp.]|nr:hypothetical protein [Neorhizobium sp.]
MTMTAADAETPIDMPAPVALRDGLESVAEPVELSLPQPPHRRVAGIRADIDAARIDTFPPAASAPKPTPVSGKPDA